MRSFQYRASLRGQIVDGTVLANDRMSAWTQLIGEGYTEVSFGSGTALSLLKRDPSTEDLYVFSEEVAEYLEAEIPFEQTMHDISLLCSNERLRAGILRIRTAVKKGVSIPEAFQEIGMFPSFVVNMLRIAEVTGGYHKVFRYIAEYLKRKDSLIQKIKSAFLMPAVVLIALMGFLTLVAIKLAPAMQKTYAAAKLDLPMSTQIVFAISYIVNTFWYLLIIGVILMILMFLSFKNKQKESYDYFCLQIPVIGELIRGQQMYEFAYNLHLLLISGVKLHEAITIMQDSAHNTVMKKVLERTGNRLSKGFSITSAIRESDKFNLFTGGMLSLLAAGETTSKIPTFMEKGANIFYHRTERQIEMYTKLAQPALMAILGVVIGFVMYAIQAPYFGMIKTIKM